MIDIEKIRHFAVEWIQSSVGFTQPRLLYHQHDWQHYHHDILVSFWLRLFLIHFMGSFYSSFHIDEFPQNNIISGEKSHDQITLFFCEFFQISNDLLCSFFSLFEIEVMHTVLLILMWPNLLVYVKCMGFEHVCVHLATVCKCRAIRKWGNDMQNKIQQNKHVWTCKYS